MSPVGFVGLGVMGQPMALHVARAGTPLVVWNRTAERTGPLLAAGATVAGSVDEVFDRCATVLLMMANREALDAVLGRATPAFASRVEGHLVVPMGTTAPDYSQALAADVRAAGGRYVEAPVSGSRGPAEAGQLIAMLAGDEDDVAEVRPLVEPMCRQTFVCGAVPTGLLMKIAVNLFLITTVTGLAESANLARRIGLDMDTFREVVDSGQMASTVSRAKSASLVTEDFTVAAAVTDVLMNSRLVVDEARRAGAAAPLIDVCTELFAEAEDLGLGGLDMAAVVRALEARSTP